MTDEITTAKGLLADLEAALDRLKPADQRFVFSWRGYLTRTGEAARIGLHRLATLRGVWSEYCEAKTESEAA